GLRHHLGRAPVRAEGIHARGDLTKPGAVGCDRPEGPAERRRARSLEHDLSPVRRPRRPRVRIAVSRELALTGAVDVRDIELAGEAGGVVAREDDLRPIRRPGRRTRGRSCCAYDMWVASVDTDHA